MTDPGGSDGQGHEPQLADDVDPGAPERRVVMLADMYGTSRRREEVGWETAYQHVRKHNVVVTNAINEACTLGNANEAEIVKYIGDAVLATFGESEVHVALDAAQRVVGGLREWSQDKGQAGIDTRIGISFGDVWNIKYLRAEREDGRGACNDLQGKAVDIAARLVADVARPNQILVDENVKGRVVEDELTDAKLVTNPSGGKLAIQGEPTNVEVFELVPSDGEGQEIQNRRKLAAEVAGLVQPAADARLIAWRLKLAVGEAIEVPSVDANSAVEDRFEGLNEKLDALRTQWRKASEVKKYATTQKPYDHLMKACSSFEDEWKENGEALRFGGDDERSPAGRAVSGSAHSIYKATGDLGTAISKALQSLIRDL